MANNNAFIDKLRAIVLENYANEQFGVSDLVEQFGMSRSQLHRKLKSATGQSISQFIREFRLDQALELLRTEDITASEVAYKVGFNSPTYFNTRFNEYFGYPPGEAQLQMELEKSASNAKLSSDTGKQKSGKNRHIPIWLTVVTFVVVALFLYKYFNMAKGEVLVPSEEKEKTIAVLPLKNWSGDVEMEYISDGITDAIISKLAEIQDIDRVIPFTSMVRYKDTNKDLKEIANELNVTYVLEGNFKLSGEQVQSNLKLIEAGTLEQVWNLEYVGAWKSDEIFAMQAEVAENVANSMSVDIANNEISELQYQLTTNEEAYRVYLKAEYQFDKLSKFGLDNAVGLYEESIALDSTFVEPYIGLGSTYIVSGAVWGLMPQQEAWRRAKPLYEQAYVLDSLRTGHNLNEIKAQLLGGIFYYELDIRETERRLKEELTNTEFVYFGGLFDYTRKTGRLDKAMKQVEGDIVLNPADGLEYMQKAFLYYMKGNTNAALE
ncbi:MAG: helix-turn-helix domain-containing protein, partial [Bacteroidia bacterium]|nr:helix-turn-helix domain-containing protein [Bacteroidia bacterium]